MSVVHALIAGEGELPVAVYQTFKESGSPLIVIKASQSDNFQLDKESNHTLDYSKLPLTIQFLKQQGCEKIIFAGRVDQKSIFKEFNDELFTPQISQPSDLTSLGDNSHFEGIVKLTEQLGFTVISLDNVLSNFAAGSGLLTHSSLSETVLKEAEHGFQIAKAVGALDIGQAIVIDKGYVLGVEGMEGTDCLVKRCAQFTGSTPSAILVKISKPRQNRQIDIPVIGINTLKHAHRSNLAGIVVEAEKTLILNKQEVIEMANKLGLFLYGMPSRGGQI